MTRYNSTGIIKFIGIIMLIISFCILFSALCRPDKKCYTCYTIERIFTVDGSYVYRVQPNDGNRTFYLTSKKGDIRQCREDVVIEVQNE